MKQLSIGDRVELVSLSCQGTVEYVNEKYVRVRWDDKKVGLLYYDANSVATARMLLRLKNG